MQSASYFDISSRVVSDEWNVVERELRWGPRFCNEFFNALPAICCMIQGRYLLGEVSSGSIFLI